MSRPLPPNSRSEHRNALSRVTGASAARTGVAALFALLAAASFLFLCRSDAVADRGQQRYLTPVEIKVSHDGKTLYVVCEEDDSLLAVDLGSGRATRKVTVGHKPRDVAISPDGKTLYVSNEWNDTVAEIDDASFTVRRLLHTGWGPIGLTTDLNGERLYVANAISDDVSVIDLRRGLEIKRLAAWRSPHYVALSRNGQRVYVSNLLPLPDLPDQPPVSELTVIDTARQVVRERIRIPGAIELRHIAEAPGKAGGYLLVPLLRPKNLNPLVQVAQGWFVTHGMAVITPDNAPVEEKRARVGQLLIDDRDKYYAGANGVAFTPDGRYALVTSAEAKFVSIIDTEKMLKLLHRPEQDDLANRLDSAQQFVVRRLPTGANPTAVAVAPDGQFAYVANRLDDSISVIDLTGGKIASTIDLGGPKELTQLRRGERLFHDASYCFQGQFVCATCHPDDHIDALAWNLETPQLGRDQMMNRTLRGIAETAPFKWNGRNPDLQTQCGPRTARFIFHSEGFNHDELEDLVAFVKAIPLAPNRHLRPDGRLTPAQERGRQIFFSKGCFECHTPETHYTARVSADVGTAARHDTSGLFDIPQLDRIYQRAPYLHSGAALSLEEIWTRFNPADKHAVTSDMTKQELNDLVEFLKSL
jgi:YVTN family beta-propeller protein